MSIQRSWRFGATSRLAMCAAGLAVVLICSQRAQAGFVYHDFQSPANLRLVGSAALVDGALRLTPSIPGLAGAAWNELRQPVQLGFDTSFQFRLSDLSFPADGLVFLIQNEGNDVIGPGGVGLGYGTNTDANYPGQGIPPSVAIEFDTYENGGEFFSVPDPNDNHISVHTRGSVPNDTDELYSLGWTTDIPNLKDGNVHSARINYSPGILRVFLDDPNSPALSVALDLASLIDTTDGKAYLGFTASTGAASENHDILNWSVTPAVIPLPAALWPGLAMLGIAALVAKRWQTKKEVP